MEPRIRYAETKDGVEFRDAGRRQVKGIKGRQRLYEVVWE
jgi:hypothetical protein